MASILSNGEVGYKVNRFEDRGAEIFKRFASLFPERFGKVTRTRDKGFVDIITDGPEGKKKFMVELKIRDSVNRYPDIMIECDKLFYMYDCYMRPWKLEGYYSKMPLQNFRKTLMFGEDEEPYPLIPYYVNLERENELSADYRITITDLRRPVIGRFVAGCDLRKSEMEIAEPVIRFLLSKENSEEYIYDDSRKVIKETIRGEDSLPKLPDIPYTEVEIDGRKVRKYDESFFFKGINNYELVDTSKDDLRKELEMCRKTILARDLSAKTEIEELKARLSKYEKV